MNPVTLEFRKDEDSIRLLAVFVAQLVREGVTYTLAQDTWSVRVTLTGGF